MQSVFSNALSVLFWVGVVIAVSSMVLMLLAFRMASRMMKVLHINAADVMQHRHLGLSRFVESKYAEQLSLVKYDLSYELDKWERDGQIDEDVDIAQVRAALADPNCVFKIDSDSRGIIFWVGEGQHWVVRPEKEQTFVRIAGVLSVAWYCDKRVRDERRRLRGKAA